jgi:branched-chain amino acid transport system permease protein
MVIGPFGFNFITFGSDLIAFFALYAIIGLSLNLEIGYAGIPNFGKALFFAGGASIAGAFAGRFAIWIFGIGSQDSFISNNPVLITKTNALMVNSPSVSIAVLLMTIVVAGVVGAILGFVASYPAIKLREDFLGMSLFAMSIFFWIFLDNYPPLVGGSNGIRIPDVFGWSGSNAYLLSVVTIALFALGAYIFMEKVVQSPFGRNLRSMRENETSAEAMGKNIATLRITVLVASSSIAAIAGALYALYSGVVLPDSIGNYIPWTAYPWMIVILGGRANNKGVIAGALVYETLSKAVSMMKFQFQGTIPFDVNWLYYLVIAGLIVTVLSTRSGGLVPESPTVTIPKSKIDQMVEDRRRKSAESKV